MRYPQTSERTVELTVVVPVLNGAETIEAQLEALAHQRWRGSWRVLIVDNGSTDGTAGIARRYTERFEGWFELVAATEEHNLAYVRNVAAELAHSRSVAFCDSDDVVAPGWVAAMGEGLRRHELVGSRLEYERLNRGDEGTSSFQSERIESLFGLPTLSGAGFGCRLDLWIRVGGNDPSWHATGEDFEFSMRTARDSGVWPVLLADAVYHYRLRSDATDAFRQYRKWGRSHVRLFKEFGDASFRPKLRPALRHSALLVLGTRRLGDRTQRDNWARAAGRRVGHLEGSVRYRTVYL